MISNNINTRMPFHQFTLKSSNYALLNAVRQVMLAHIPAFAFHNMKVLENTVDIEDEKLTINLGLIHLDNSKLKKNIEFTLDVNVAEDIMPLYPAEHITYSQKISGNLFDPKIVLCGVRKGQTLKIAGEIALGTPKEDQKFASVGTCGYIETGPDFITYKVELLGVHTIEKILEFTRKYLTAKVDEFLDVFERESRVQNGITEYFVPFGYEILRPISNELLAAGAVWTDVVHDHPMINVYSLLVSADNPEKLIRDCCASLKKKIAEI